MLTNTDDLRIQKISPLISPAILMEILPVSESAATLVQQTRQQAADIIHGRDSRLLVITGPCSIHDTEAALEYASKLQPLRAKLQDKLCIIMRVYFEKPRTTVGWKGLINDPMLDGSYQINKGLHSARQLLVDLADMGVPAGTEFLDTIIPQYIADLIAWGAIGARTSESQLHRELTSGLSMPIGIKNGTSGCINVAVDAIQAAMHPHHFLSVTKQGISAIVSTKGNEDCHIILRGGSDGPNYDQQSITTAEQLLASNKLQNRIMIDCSHGNSGKDPAKQPLVVEEIIRQYQAGSRAVCGVMLESHLQPGNQSYQDPDKLKYGVSITDACMGWSETEDCLSTLAEALSVAPESL